jgi:hypothetical protein
MPRENPYRENPSGLAVGGILLALAGLGGGGFWYYKRKIDPAGVQYTDLDQSLYNQLDEDQKAIIRNRKYDFQARVLKSSREQIIEGANKYMQRMLKPQVYDEAYFKWVDEQVATTGKVRFGDYPTPRYATREEAKQLVADGKFEWSKGRDSVSLREDLRPAGAAKATGRKPEAKKDKKK